MIKIKNIILLALFVTLGCSNSIVNKFKRNQSQSEPTSEKNFYNIFKQSKKTPINLLEEIYNELIKKEGGTSVYGIANDDLIIYI